MEKRHTLGMMTISHNAGAQGGAGCIRLYNVGSCKYSGVCLVLSWYRAPSMLWKLGATAKPKPTGPPHSQCFVPVLGHKMSPKERQSGGAWEKAARQESSREEGEDLGRAISRCHLT